MSAETVMSRVNVARALTLFGYKAAFKTMGLESAGRALIEALDSPDETVRTLAAMSLVQIGERSLPLLRAELARGQHVTQVLTMMADIGDVNSQRDIETFVDSADPVIAASARDALLALKLGASADQRSQRV